MSYLSYICLLPYTYLPTSKISSKQSYFRKLIIINISFIDIGRGFLTNDHQLKPLQLLPDHDKCRTKPFSCGRIYVGIMYTTVAAFKTTPIAFCILLHHTADPLVLRVHDLTINEEEVRLHLSPFRNTL